MANSDWTINTDIYDIVDSIHNVQKRYIEDEDETTLSLGIFGFITDTEAKKIQTATIMAGQLGNEMFPTRAILTKNILTHAANSGITDFNATPARIVTTICIKTSDVIKNIDGSGNFYIDANCPIFIEQFEFHLDYDVRINTKRVTYYDANNVAKTKQTYSAQYIVTNEDGSPIINRLSDLRNPYINQPFIINIGGVEYVGIQVTLRQCSIDEIVDSTRADSVIENKTYSFDFLNQLADFKVVIKDPVLNKTIEMTPYMRGESIADETGYYCWYIYTGERTIRISFDSFSYIPGLNCEIYIKVYTTLGSKGNFEYLKIDQTSDGLYVDIESPKFGYKPITSYLVAVTDSENGTDRKTKEELQKMIPKANISRGSITTETDLNNYFNLINTDTNRLVMDKKIDNQLDRIWYGYFLLKDDFGNIIPTNTITLKVKLPARGEEETSFVKKCRDGSYILPAGTTIRLDTTNMVGEPIEEDRMPAFIDTKNYFNGGYFYYTCLYNIIIHTDPLYCSYFMTACNYESYFTYDYVNQDSLAQFIANRFHVEKNMLVERTAYKIDFAIAQATNDADIIGIMKRDRVTRINPDGSTYTEVIETQTIRVVLVLYRDGEPYRWKECRYIPANSSESSSIYKFECEIVSDSSFDNENRMMIKEMCEPGSISNMYGYVDDNTEARIFIMIADEKQDNNVYFHPRKDIDDIAPGFENFIVTNIYKCIDGIDFFVNFTGVTDTKISNISGSSTVYTIDGVPVVGRHYLDNSEEFSYLLEAVKERKAYIDHCLTLVENSMNVDFKFFNTYGPSRTYALSENGNFIDHVDLIMRFRMSIRDNVDASILANIKADIKAYVENINNIDDWHAPNLVTLITTTYRDSINFFEFIGFNIYTEEDQHIIKQEVKDPRIVPEFINIRNTFDLDNGEWTPCIDIELV